MTAQCQACLTVFDSNDGGDACQECGRAYCPDCKDEHMEKPGQCKICAAPLVRTGQGSYIQDWPNVN